MINIWFAPTEDLIGVVTGGVFMAWGAGWFFTTFPAKTILGRVVFGILLTCGSLIFWFFLSAVISGFVAMIRKYFRRGAMSVFKPCPFCGSQDIEMHEDSYGSRHVMCEHCGVHTSEVEVFTEQQAIYRWNQRAYETEAKQ